MVKNLISKISDIDKSILKVIKNIFKVSFGICIIAVLILFAYIYNPSSHITYLAGLSLFKSSLMISVFGFICGISTDLIKK